MASALVVLLFSGGFGFALWRLDASQEEYERALRHSRAMNAVGEARDEMLDTSAYVSRYMLEKDPVDRQELKEESREFSEGLRKVEIVSADPTIERLITRTREAHRSLVAYTNEQTLPKARTHAASGALHGWFDREEDIEELLDDLADATENRIDTEEAVAKRAVAGARALAFLMAILAVGGIVGLAFYARRLIASNERLIEAQKLKDNFVSVVSHELRTPLTSIRGSLGLLSSGVLGPLPEKGQRMFDVAVENTDRLVRLINDILDVQKMNSGHVELHKETCDSRVLIERAVNEMEGMAQDHGVTLKVAGEHVLLSADPDRMLRVLTNLLSNAIKFSDRGTAVWVSAKRRGDEVLFTVRDEGRGISVDQLDAIFGEFHQVDSSDTREKGGTGLGLAICKKIVEHHNGRIWAQSTPGEGSTFSFLVRAQVSDEAPPEAGERAAELVSSERRSSAQS